MTRPRGTGTVYRRKGRKGWYYRLPGENSEGKPHKPVHVPGFKAAAETALDERLRRDDWAGHGGGRIRVSEYLDRYKAVHEVRVNSTTLRGEQTTHERDASRFNVAAAWFKEQGDPFIANVTVEDAQRFLDELAAKRAPATVRNYRSNLSAAWAHAVLEDVAETNIWRGRAVKGSRQVVVPYMSAEEVRRNVYDVLPHQEVRMIAVLCGETGMRRGEAMSLRWRDIGTDAKLNVRAKNKRDRRVWAPPWVLAELRDYRTDADPAAFVFNLNRETIRYWWVKTGIPIRFHDLRHIYGSRMARTGETTSDIAKQLGHSHAMALRYSQHGPIDAAERAARRMHAAESQASEMRGSATTGNS